MRTSEQTNELVAALAKARPKCKPIVKDTAVNAGQRQYSYAKLENVVDAITEPLAAQGLVVFQAFDAETSTLITRLAHISGQFVESAYPLHPYERPQDFGSQATYSRRYSLLALLNLASEDDDGQAAQDAPRAAHPAPAPQTTPQAREAPAAPLVYREAHVTNVEFDEGVSAKTNKPWKRWRITFDDGSPMASTFSQTLGDAAREAFELGARVQYATETSPRGVNLLKLEPALF
jgi:pyruvate/2-oxoglutarate dehydrogenase complex dihydrolipoamide acyltransferase (E2) component